MDVSAAAEAYGRPNAITPRFEELEESKRWEVNARVPVTEALAKAGKQPISVRWVGVNKGDARNTENRSRLVVWEAERSQVDDVFAAMPPRRAKKLLFSLAAGGRATSGNAGD